MSFWMPPRRALGNAVVPWRFRFAPPEPDQSVRAAVGLIAERDLLAQERDEARSERDEARSELYLANAEVFQLGEQLADARRQLAEQSPLPASEEGRHYKRIAEQDRANCLLMQKALDDARAQLQLVELELLWATHPALVDKGGMEKVRRAVS